MRELRDRHHQAISFLLLGRTQTEVAKRVGVKYSTVSAWFNDPLFREELERRRENIKKDAERKIQNTLDVAVNKLQEVLLDGSDPNAVRSAVEFLRVNGFYTEKIELGPLQVEHMNKEQLIDMQNRVQRELSSKLTTEEIEAEIESLSHNIEETTKIIESSTNENPEGKELLRKRQEGVLRERGLISARENP